MKDRTGRTTSLYIKQGSPPQRNRLPPAKISPAGKHAYSGHDDVIDQRGADLPEGAEEKLLTEIRDLLKKV